MTMTMTSLKSNSKQAPLFSLPLKWREKRFARSASHEILKLFANERAANPNLNSREIYVRVAAQRMQASADVARRAVRSAEDSFASWPYDRDLRFNDVVHYLVINEFMEINNVADGVGPHIKEIVEEVIPYNL